MTGLVEYGREEMQRVGLYDKDADYGGIGPYVEEILKVLASQGHSGGSHQYIMFVLNRVANFKPLGPLTSNPEEWMEVEAGLWQNRRQPSAFSQDGGKTYYDLDEGRRNGSRVIHRCS